MLRIVRPKHLYHISEECSNISPFLYIYMYMNNDIPKDGILPCSYKNKLSQVYTITSCISMGSPITESIYIFLFAGIYQH